MTGLPPLEASPVVIDLGIRLGTRFAISRKVSPEEANRRGHIEWCLTEGCRFT